MADLAVSTLDRVCMCACMTASTVPTRQGEVLAWGINDFGQLGNGSTFYETSPTQVQPSVVLSVFCSSPIIRAGKT